MPFESLKVLEVATLSESRTAECSNINNLELPSKNTSKIDIFNDVSIQT